MNYPVYFQTIVRLKKVKYETLKIPSQTKTNI
jgi:hypothetical protein